MLCKETGYISTTVAFSTTTPTQQTTGFTINYGISKQPNESLTTPIQPLNDKTTSRLNNEMTVSNFF